MNATADTTGSRRLIELAITLVIPSLILMQLSGPEDPGAVNALPHGAKPS